MKITYDIFEQPKSNHDNNDSETIYRSILKALNQLHPRDQKVIQLYFGINESKDHTVEEIGQYFFITKERANQRLIKSIQKIRRVFTETNELKELQHLVPDFGCEDDLDFSFIKVTDQSVERQSKPEEDDQEQSFNDNEYKSPDFETELDNISNQYTFDFESYIGVDALLKISNR
jgi:hypothetical protein